MMRTEMVLKGRTNLHLYVSCFYMWILPYGLFITAVEMTSYSIMTMLTIGPLISYLMILYWGLRRPPEAVVREVLGEPIRERSRTLKSFSKIVPENPLGSNIFTVYAHRFAGMEAPENTLCALDQCIQNGAKGVEFDLILTADFVPVVFHDCKLERMTGLAEDITKLPYSKVQELNVSVYHHFREKFPDTRIPLFEDVVKKCIENDIRMIIDIKEDRYEVVNVVLETFKKYPILYTRAMISAFNPWIIYSIRKLDPSIVGALAWRPFYMSYCQYSPYEDECIPYHKTMLMYYISRVCDLIHTFFFQNIAHDLIGISAVLIYKDSITMETINYWKDRNVRSMAWTVNSPLEKQYFVKELGLAYITDTMLGTSED